MASQKKDFLLVERCKKGDNRAFNDLINGYKRQVYSLIYRMVNNAADAEDLAQETFIKIFRRIGLYDSNFPFHAWLFKIAHNTAIDFLRANKNPALSIDDYDNPIDVEDKSISLEEKTEHLSQKELIERQLAALPPPYKEILILRHQQELSYEEIADTLEIPVGTVKVRLFRAREIMKEKLARTGVFA
ncbi:MAG: sigma-70 family RNA polymerase sigma factor [Candidatus Edwardsbacteria bacterium]|nr:sigma-70 family RNA polymerase sigma factor [Candidatus Edwardsbacteria bacterium]